MKIQELMTRSVETLDERATLQDAARRMAELDVGALPVARGGKTVGIITDRDIAVRGVAEDLSPTHTRVGDIMTTDVSYCRETDDIEKAVDTMQERQIRRLLVMDQNDRLCGIVSLGDLALRSGADQLTEQLLERISVPMHPYRHRATPRRRQHAAEAAAVAGTGLGGIMAGAIGGAALMYLLDPERGRRRRALLRDQMVHLTRQTTANLRRQFEYTSGQARGMCAMTAARFRGDDEPTNRVLVERVRSAMGRVVAHPHAIDVAAEDGVVTLSGPILENEVDRLLATVEQVRGVYKVEDELDVHSHRENIPALQGRESSRRAANGQRGRTSLAYGTIGPALAWWGLRRRDPVGIGATLVGGMLAAQAMTPRSSQAAGTSATGLRIRKTLHINAPLEAVYDFWSNFENFPRAMKNVREVTNLGAGRSRWVVAGPAGTSVQWDAQITQQVPNQLIEWTTIEPAQVRNQGQVRFRPERGGTRIDIQMTYQPPGGSPGHWLARMMGADPRSEINQDLMRLKTLLETGHAPHDAARKGGAAPVPVHAS